MSSCHIEGFALQKARDRTCSGSHIVTPRFPFSRRQFSLSSSFDFKRSNSPPPVVRKSGMPAPVDIPAPVKMTIFRYPPLTKFSKSSSSSKYGRYISVCGLLQKEAERRPARYSRFQCFRPPWCILSDTSLCKSNRTHYTNVAEECHPYDSLKRAPKNNHLRCHPFSSSLRAANFPSQTIETDRHWWFHF
jgi:hypothetical protein